MSFEWQHCRISSTDLKVRVKNNLAITWYRTERFNLEKKHVKLNVRHVGLKVFLTPYLNDKPVGYELMTFITREESCKYSSATNKKPVLVGVVCHKNLLDSLNNSQNSEIIIYTNTPSKIFPF